MPVLDRNIFAPAAGLLKGAYVLRDTPHKNPDIILIATGSEVQLALGAAKELEAKGKGVRVVSMPSWELFDRQPEAYRQEVLPNHIEARIAIEAGITQGWHRYVGRGGEVIGLDHFGASAPYLVLYEKFGITSERVIERALAILSRD